MHNLIVLWGQSPGVFEAFGGCPQGPGTGRSRVLSARPVMGGAGECPIEKAAVVGTRGKSARAYP